MAKKRNLLLTTLLAVVCLTALLVASFVVGGGESPAQAETRLEYVKNNSIAVSESPVLIVNQSSSNYYAMTNNNGTLTATQVYLTSDGASIDTSKTTVNDNMLWIISSGVKITSYLDSTKKLYADEDTSGATVTLNSSGQSFEISGNLFKLSSWKTFYIYCNNSAYSMSSGGTSFITFTRQEVAVETVTITLTIDGQPDATRTMQVESGKTTTLPNPDTSDLWETKPTPDGKQFSHWINESGEQVLDAFSSTTDVTLTAVFAEPITYVKSIAKRFETSDKPVLIGALSGANYYVLSANGTTGVKSVNLGQVGEEITDTSKITKDMLWNIEVSNSWVYIQNVATGSYLTIDTPNSWTKNIILSSTKSYLEHGATSFADKMEMKKGSNYINLSGVSVSVSTSNSTTWVIYQQPVDPNSLANISFDGGNDQATGSVTGVEGFKKGEKYTLPSNGFSLSKYKFAGWKIQGDKTNTIYQPRAEVVINEDTTFVATWTYDYCAVTFELDGQTPIAEPEYKKGGSLPSFETVFPNYKIPDDKIVSGWLNKATNSRLYSVPQDESVTIIPNFVDAIWVKLDLNGGTTTNTSTTALVETGKKIEKGGSYSLMWSGADGYGITRADYTFAGWKISGTDTILEYAQTVRDLNADTTFIAQWKYSGHTVNFMFDGEIVGTILLPLDQNTGYIQINNTDPDGANYIPDAQLSGWTFDGWYEGTTKLDGKFYWAKTSTQTTKEFTAKLVKDITLTFTYNDETLLTAVVENADYAASTSLNGNNLYKGYPDKLPNGKLFDHWELADGTVITQITNKDGDATIKIVAKDGFKITFDLNGGIMNANVADKLNGTFGPNYVQEVITASAAITTNYQPSRDAYILDGWKCGELTVKSGESFDVTSDMKFVAQWKFDGTMLTFKADGQEDEQVAIPSGTESYVIAVDDPTVAQGKVFLGWKIEGDSSDTLYKKGETLTIPAATDAITLIAQTRDLETYTVTLHYGEQTARLQFVEGTSNIQILESTFTEKFGALDATKKYHGWFKDAAFTSEFDASLHKADGQDVKTMDLYAKVTDVWTVKFTFYPKADSVTRTNNDGKGVPTLIVSDTDAVKMEGYNLIGWSKTKNGEIAYSALSTAYGVTIKESCELFAIWQITTEGQAALDKAIADAKTELTAYAQGLGVTAPSAADIENAKFVEEVNAALTAAKAAADATAAQASKAKVDAAKAAVAALSGKTGEALFNQLKAVDAALADLSAEEKAQVDLAAYNTAKAQLEALVSGAEADLEAANTAGATIAAAKIGAAVAALASLAALAFVLKRGIL